MKRSSGATMAPGASYFQFVNEPFGLRPNNRCNMAKACCEAGSQAWSCRKSAAF